MCYCGGTHPCRDHEGARQNSQPQTFQHHELHSNRITWGNESFMKQDEDGGPLAGRRDAASLRRVRSCTPTILGACLVGQLTAEEDPADDGADDAHRESPRHQLIEQAPSVRPRGALARHNAPSVDNGDMSTR